MTMMNKNQYKARIGLHHCLRNQIFPSSLWHRVSTNQNVWMLYLTLTESRLLAIKLRKKSSM